MATVVLAVLVATACAAPTASRDFTGARDIAAPHKQLDEYLAQCTARYGYDPEATSDIGQYALGAGERDWRECVYQGVEKYLISTTLTPEVYRRAIAEDRKMTESVARGQMTRTQRRARVQELLEEIERIEEASRGKLEQQMQSVDRLVKDELQRQQDTMRRALVRPLAR